VPKIRTHKPTSKRFRISRGGKGKLLRTKGPKSHFRRKTSRRTKALFDDMVDVKSKGLTRRIHRLAPYLSKKS